MPASVRSGLAGEQCSGNLCCGCNCGRIAHQRNFHRKRTFPRQANRRGSEEKSAARFAAGQSGSFAISSSWISSGIDAIEFVVCCRCIEETAQNKTPGRFARGPYCNLLSSHTRSLRRIWVPRATRPVPIKANDPGSGTTDDGDPLAYPVLSSSSPHFEPEAVQKWMTTPVN